MPKLDFFSGQPDDAKAAQEDSSASSEQWEDAFAGMQKLDLFEEPSVNGGAVQPTVDTVPSAVPGTVQAGVSAAAPAPQEESKASKTGRAIFENLFSAEEEEEETLLPPSPPPAAQPEQPIPDVILPGSVQAQVPVSAPVQPAVQMPVAQPAVQAAPPVQAEMPQTQPQPQPVAAPVQQQVHTPMPEEHVPAADVASVPVFEEEAAPESQPETESMFPKEEPRRVTKAKPINWHVNMLEEKEKEMIVKALEKNHGKRKLAAQDLGISERTLYRKLKEYDIEI